MTLVCIYNVAVAYLVAIEEAPVRFRLDALLAWVTGNFSNPDQGACFKTCLGAHLQLLREAAGAIRL
jgi:hypothetical protein